MSSVTLIILISLVLGVAGGVIMHRADFCLAGAIRDIFLFRSSPLLPSLVLLIALNIVLIEVARLAGWVTYDLPSSLFGLPSLTTFAGGLFFGIGMVLAGGCVVGVLYKFGAGSFAALIAIAGMLIGSVVYVSVHPYWTVLAQQTRLSEAATLAQLLGVNQTVMMALVVLLLLYLVVRWHRQGLLVRPSFVGGYLQPRTAAVLLAFITLVSFAIVGMPLGITTSYSKAGAYFAQLFAPGWIASQEFLQLRGFSYYSPVAETVLNAGPGPYFDGLSLVQFPLIGGIVLGAFFSSVLMKKFTIHWKVPIIQLAAALSGGILMGMASRMSPACNVWHLLGGIPLLSLQSALFFIGLFPGAWIGTRLLTRYVVRV
ncbi:MAG: YeeE/YedE family protein [Pelovirga sp.]